MKKLVAVLLLLFTFTLAACSFQTVEQYEKMEQQQRSIENEQLEQQPVKEEVEKIEEVKEEKEVDKAEITTEETPQVTEQVIEEKTEQIAPSPKTEDKEQTPEQKPQEKTQQLEKSEQSNVKASVSKPVENATSAVTPQKKQEATAKPAEQPKRYVTISIHADTLLTHWDMLDPSLQSEQYVPSDGTILATKKYELLTEKDTVWNVLQRAVKEHKIHLEYEGANENVYNNVYIEGINHLYEFSAGPLSGWMYKVNGVYPSYGCSQYILKDGDSIEWHYTVDLGRDLGADR